MADQPADQVIDIAERPRLLAVAEDGDVLIAQRLHDEARHHATVIGVGARTIGVEDADDLDRQAMLPPIVEEQRLGAALALVIARARSDRIDMPPIGFGCGCTDGSP